VPRDGGNKCSKGGEVRPGGRAFRICKGRRTIEKCDGKGPEPAGSKMEPEGGTWHVKKKVKTTSIRLSEKFEREAKARHTKVVQRKSKKDSSAKTCPRGRKKK